MCEHEQALEQLSGRYEWKTRELNTANAEIERLQRELYEARQQVHPFRLDKEDDWAD